MAERKKVVDIFPSRKSTVLPRETVVREQIQEAESVSVPEMVTEGIGEKEASRFSLIKKVVIGVGVLSVLVVATLHMFFSQASIYVEPETRELTVTALIIGNGEAVDRDSGVYSLPVQVFRAEEEMTSLFPASGTQHKGIKAQGTIRVYNEYTTSPQALVENTRFVSEEGILFRSTKRITIPGGHYEGGKLVAGYIDITVAAAEPGEKYNIGPSNFSLPGLAGSELFTTVYAQSFQDIQGGSQGDVAIVTADDIEAARLSIIAALTQKTTRFLREQASGDIIMLSDSFSTEVLDSLTLAKEGSQLNQFNYTMKIRTTAFGFEREKGENIARQLLQGEMADTEQIDQGTLSLSYTTVDSNTNLETISITAEVTAIVYYAVDLIQLKIKLRGSAVDEANTILAGYPHVAAAAVSLWPFWINTVPDDIEKIEITSSFALED
ncbi:hypothetical protein IID24_04160 [Patescibacteria group bacterium]|nr:hypothetical protein [Patescibacteria group bacterium]